MKMVELVRRNRIMQLRALGTLVPVDMCVKTRVASVDPATVRRDAALEAAYDAASMVHVVPLMQEDALDESDLQTQCKNMYYGILAHEGML